MIKFDQEIQQVNSKSLNFIQYDWSSTESHAKQKLENKIIHDLKNDSIEEKIKSQKGVNLYIHTSELDVLSEDQKN